MRPNTLYSRKPIDPNRVLLLLAGTYVTLLCLASLSGSGVAKAIANLFAIVIFATALVNWMFLTATARKMKLIYGSLSLFYVGLLGSVFFGTEGHDIVDLIKLGLVPAFILFGATFESRSGDWNWSLIQPRILFGSLLCLPILVWLIQMAISGNWTSDSREVGIFANRNNAGLYVITLLAALQTVRATPVSNLWIYLGVGTMFGTLGLLIAVCLATVLAKGGLRTYIGLIVGLTSCLFVVANNPEIGRLTRIGPVIDSVLLLASGDIQISTVTYAELVQRLHTTDLSFIFRLKHWDNLLSIFTSGSLINLLFGFGIGSAVKLSQMHLVPHNDYLRVLFEFGSLAFVGFLFLLIGIIRGIGRGFAQIPFLVVAIYFFSENLLNNFIAMIFFFYSAGFVIQRKLRQ